jgi:hypothetical protein
LKKPKEQIEMTHAKRRDETTLHLTRLEDEVRDRLTGMPVFNEPEPLPVPETLDIARLSADAVLQQFEAAAKAVEEMGVAIKQRVAALEAALHECDSDLKLLTEAAAAIREKGRHAEAQIERTASISRDIRAVISDCRAKIA